MTGCMHGVIKRARGSQGWLVSNSLNQDSVSVNILPVPLTDHKVISININLLPGNKNAKRNIYWKMNSSLLNHDNVKFELTRLIKLSWGKAQSEGLYSTNMK